MSLDNCDAVDAVGIEYGSTTVVLSIVDSWDWEEEQHHLAALQKKLNAYFGFIESGQIYDSYPDAVGKMLRIDIIGRFAVPTGCLGFLDKASAVASQLSVGITHRLHA